MHTEKMLVYNTFFLLLLSTVSTADIFYTYYAPVTSAQHLQLLAHYAVTNQTACAGFCDQNNECTGFSYKTTPLENKCALLGAVIPTEVCLMSKQIFQKQKPIIICHYGPLPVNIQTDPCIDSVVSRLNSPTMCTRVIGGNSSYYIIRATLQDGTMMTLDNNMGSKFACSGGLYIYTYSYDNVVRFSQPLATASCVLAGSTKCPCAHLPLTEGATSVAVVDQINPCPANTELHFFHTNLNNTRSIGQSDTVLTVITCMAGDWFMFQTVTGDTWKVKSAGCK